MSSEDYVPPSSPIMVNNVNKSAIRRDSISNDLSSNKICTMFSEFLNEFERMEKSGVATTNMFLDAVEEIATAVLSIAPHKLLDPTVLAHPLMQFLYQMLVDILDNWQASQLRLNIQETDIFLKITLIFIHAAEQVPKSGGDEDKKRITDILATKKFLHLVKEQIHDNINNKDGINDDPNICTLGLLTITLLQGCPFYYTIGQNEQLIDYMVMSCLDSYDYIHSIHQFRHGETLTDIDSFLLYTCWEYIPFASTTSKNSIPSSQSPKLAQDTYDDLLTRLQQALDEPPSITPSYLAYIFERCTQLLNIPNLLSFDKHTPHIIDRLATILQTPRPTTPDNQALITTALEAFNNLSKNTDIRTVMRKRQLTSVITKYTSGGTRDKQKLAFDILAQIMDEEEVRKDPAEITGIFIDQLKQLDPTDPTALASLQALMQHDQVKDEFIKQDGLQTLVAFVRDGDVKQQSSQQVEDALKILWSCTFNNPQVTNTLRQDAKLLERVNQWHATGKQTSNSSLEKAAEGLIWKVEKEEKFKEQQAAADQRKKQEKAQQGSANVDEEEESEAEQYDMMISYSWADMDLAHQIFKHLTEKLGYKVWLDQEQMHGSTIEAMANAVEGAQFILMCMSETYKRSANCQSEAEYAFNRKKHIVPCKMKKDFTADGWLGFILGTRMYIDFGSYEFDKAIGLLDNEIQLQKKKRKEAKQVAKERKEAAEEGETQTEAKEKVPSDPVVTKAKMNAENIASWNEDEVRGFLMKHSLPAMVQLCDGITGDELFDLYCMCKVNAASMYRSLKFELLHGHHRILPISTFLRFMGRMRAVCQDEVSFNTQAANKVQRVHFKQDD